MKFICVSVDKREEVLESYLKRVCGAHVVMKKSLKTIRFAEKNLTMRNAWTLKQFKNFCEATAGNKNIFKVYKTSLVKPETRKI